MFRKVLIANRGEIALRIIRTLREMGITSVAAFSDADRDARFVEAADESYRLGPPPSSESYLNVGAILDVGRRAGVQAIHPGYGFLAENAEFAEDVEEAGMTFIGPSPASMRLMGDKVQARRAVQVLGVLVVPGSPGPVGGLGEASNIAEKIGFPVAVKAAGGGGGRGIRVVTDPRNLAEALEGASREAATHFKNAEVYLERYFSGPRHVEVQVLGDKHGKIIHLGERDCSVQRRHQKLIEESPAPSVGPALRERMGEMAVRAARSAEYFSAGTVEFLVTQDGEFYFLEMNTRVQVEHPITECVTGVDLIREMILVASGERLAYESSFLNPYGHAIEVRINAEDPRHGFRPTPALVEEYREPAGIGIRVDSGVARGFTIPDSYDSLIAKLIVWAPDREQSRRRALRALDEFRIAGPETTIPFARAVLDHPVFVSGDIDTTFIESHMSELVAALHPAEATAATGDSISSRRGPERTFAVDVNRRRFKVSVAEILEDRADVKPASKGRRTAPSHSSSGNSSSLFSPMHGTVVSIRREKGEVVEAGDPMVVIEAMKMENEVAAHRSGTVGVVKIRVGQTVESGQELCTIE